MKNLVLTLLLTSTLAWGSYVIPLNAITTAKIADGAVTTSKIVDGAVTSTKLSARTSSGSSATLGNVAYSSSSGDYQTNSSSFVTVTNMSISITTMGRPVHVFAQSDGTVSTTGSVNYSTGDGNSNCKIVRGATDLSAYTAQVTYIPVSGLSAIDLVSAGTYTYTIQCKYTGSTGYAFFIRARLVAYEI